MDICLIVTNGLSSTAVERHGIPLFSAVLLALGARHLNAGPVVLAPNGRVGLSDEVGRPSVHARRPSSWASARGCPPPTAWGSI